MKIIERIRLVVRKPEWGDRLREIYPKGLTNKVSFNCDLEFNDSTLLAVKKLLFDDFNLRPWDGNGKRDKAKEYTVYTSREYDQADIDSAEFLELKPLFGVHSCGVEDGLIQLPGLDLDPDKMEMASTSEREIIVPERTRLKLKGSDLCGVQFTYTEILPDVTADSLLRSDIEFGEVEAEPYDGEPWYVLSSAVELPPVSPSMQLVDPQQNPVEVGTQKKGVRFVEPPFDRAEIHYQRKDVEQFPEFDLAHTWENFAGPLELIASKRFYQACQDLDIDMGWVPVRIDED